jgi:tetratricopeptide (TPR) repeat protein
VLTLYRGIIIPETQKTYYNDMEGKLILTKGFTSTTRQRDIALGFTGQDWDPALDPDKETGVLFEITVDLQDNILFANIAGRSVYREEEILFGPNATFRVESVNFDPTMNCLMIRTTATAVFEDFLHQYLRLEQEELRNYQPFAYLGRLLFDKFGRLEAAEKYFEMLLKKLPSNHDNIPAIYVQMGDLNLLQKNYNTAVDYYEKAMKYYKRHSADNTNIIDCLLKIGNTRLSEGNKRYYYTSYLLYSSVFVL